jgi:glucose uptake protein
MFIVQDYPIAVLLCVVTMLCWGSWANTQKLVGAGWRFELFYWDYVIGVVLAAVLLALTLGNLGTHGRSVLADLQQAEWASFRSAAFGGVVFNAANILLVAAIDIAGMSVAFPVGIGLALVVGVLVNYWVNPLGNPWLLFGGVALIAVAIVLDALAYRRLPGQKQAGVKGLMLSAACGLLMGTFYRFVAGAMSADFVTLGAGKLGPYAAMICFSTGLVASNLLFNTLLMRRPVTGAPIPFSRYFAGASSDHLWGVVGGGIWAIGMTLSIIAAGQAGFAISYGLGQGATLVAALWGVFVWREFRHARAGTGLLIALMFAGYALGLAALVAARLA